MKQILMLFFAAALSAVSSFAVAQECPLCDPAYNGDVAEVKRLLAEGVDVNATDDDEIGETALSKAAQQGNTEIVLILLTAGADPDKRGGVGTLPLLAAVQQGNAEMTRMLLAAGADPDGTAEPGTVKGIAALMWASNSGHVEIVKALVSAGADVNYSTPEWYTALHQAKSQGHSEIVRILEEAGATKTPEDVDAEVLGSLVVYQDAHFCWRYGLPYFRLNVGYTERQRLWCSRCAHADDEHSILDPGQTEKIIWCLRNAYQE